MKILGFNCYSHDAAATLLVDDKIKFAVEDERLSRKKHCGGFPELAIQACLDSQKLKLNDIDHIGFFWKPWLSYPKIPGFFLRYLPNMLSLLKESRDWTMEENMGMFNYWKSMHALPKKLNTLFNDGKKTHAKFHYIEHHACHAASAFFCSPYESAAIMSVDGGGEWTTSQLAFGQKNSITKLSTVDIPHSLGAFYQAVARYVGFDIMTGPGKLMGLSAYGDKNHSTYTKMKSLIKLKNDGGFELDLKYFSYHYTRSRGVSPYFEEVFGPPAERKGSGNSKSIDWKENHYNVAAAAQRIVEDVFIHMANVLHQKTKSDNLCIAGGVGLNSVANGRLLNETPFKNIFIQPATGDSGTSLGATLWINHAILNRPNREVMKNSFLGPEYDNIEIESEIQRLGLPYFQTDNYTQIAAKLLNQNKILGWFQGCMEFGPRALGNRSIIANPCQKDMKEILNKRVKFREGFRPFAPIILEEHCGEYFDQSYPNPFMLLVYSVLPEMRDKIPAVTHVDGTGRIQTVNREENPQMWQLLQDFNKESGVPILINTSFNVKGEPIVCTPFDAADSFNRADMDYLIMGSYIVAKTEKDLALAKEAQGSLVV